MNATVYVQESGEWRVLKDISDKSRERLIKQVKRLPVGRYLLEIHERIIVNGEGE